MKEKNGGWIAASAVCLMVIVSANAFFALWKDGGARPEGYVNFADYVGPLTLVPYAWALLSIALCISIVAAQKWRLPRSPLNGLFPFSAVLFVSIFWADDPLEAAKVFVPIFSGFLLIVLVHRRYGLNFLLRNVEFAVYLIVVMSYVYSILIPSYGIAQGVHDGLWQGVFSHKNNLGNFSLLSVAFCLLLWVSYKKIRSIVLCVAAAGLVYMSGSTASLMGLVVLLGLFLLQHLLAARLSGRQLYSLAYWAVLFFVFLTIFLVGFTFLVPDLQIMEKDSSFSGRDLIWGFFLLRAIESPIFGYGLGQISMGNVSLVDSISDYVGFVASSTHNGFIDALYSVGLVGVVFLFRFLTGLCRYLLISKKAFSVIWLGIIPLLFVNSFESRLLSFNSYILFFVIYGVWAKDVASKNAMGGGACG